MDFGERSTRNVHQCRTGVTLHHPSRAPLLRRGGTLGQRQLPTATVLLGVLVVDMIRLEPVLTVQGGSTTGSEAMMSSQIRTLMNEITVLHGFKLHRRTVEPREAGSDNA